MEPFSNGMFVQTLNGELDSDENGDERYTPPGSVGRIASLNHVDRQGMRHWNVHYPNGAAVVLSDDELRDPAQYRIATPSTQPAITVTLTADQWEAIAAFCDRGIDAQGEWLGSAQPSDVDDREGECSFNAAGTAALAALRVQIAGTPTAQSEYEWRLTPAGAWVLHNREGAQVGHCYTVPAGWMADPWGREKRTFRGEEEAKAHVIKALQR